jgi:hypothetical protein
MPPYSGYTSRKILRGVCVCVFGLLLQDLLCVRGEEGDSEGHVL